MGSRVTVKNQTVIPLEDGKVVNQVFSLIDRFLEQGTLRKNIFVGLVYSYFEYPEGGLSCRLGAWEELRDIIHRGMVYFKDFYASKPRQWFSKIQVHQEMLGLGVAEYAYAEFEKDSEIKELRSALNIPDRSWVWRDIVQMRLEVIKKQHERLFFQSVDGYIAFAKQFHSYIDQILATVLERYKDSSRRLQPHIPLKEFAIETWGLPGIGLGKSRWNTYASEETRKMVGSWIARENLRIFFEVIAGTRSNIEHERFRFWLRYLGSITFTRIYLNQDAKQTPNLELRQYIEKSNGAFSWINGTANTHAFLLNIGDYCFLEFSHIGNACYVYHKDRLPFSLDASDVRFFLMKNKMLATDRILHTTGWQYNAEWMLKRIGIYPD